MLWMFGGRGLGFGRCSAQDFFGSKRQLMVQRARWEKRRTIRWEQAKHMERWRHAERTLGSRSRIDPLD